MTRLLSNMLREPEEVKLHVVVPGGGLSLDGKRWIACRSGFFLPVMVLSKLIRRLFLEALIRLHKAGKLRFFGGPEAVLAYLSRHTRLPRERHTPK